MASQHLNTEEAKRLQSALALAPSRAIETLYSSAENFDPTSTLCPACQCADHDTPDSNLFHMLQDCSCGCNQINQTN